MSKSLGNYIGINEPPEEIFGKLMSISDDLMWRYAELLSERPLEEIRNIKSQVAAGAAHPMDFKKALAQEIAARFHGPDAAGAARDYFENRYQKRQTPKDIPQFSPPERVGICQLLVDLKFARSKREARGLVAQGAVRVDGQAITDINFEFQKKLHRLIEVGKMRIAEAAERKKPFFAPLDSRPPRPKSIMVAEGCT